MPYNDFCVVTSSLKSVDKLLKHTCLRRSVFKLFKLDVKVEYMYYVGRYLLVIYDSLMRHCDLY